MRAFHPGRNRLIVEMIRDASHLFNHMERCVRLVRYAQKENESISIGKTAVRTISRAGRRAVLMCDNQPLRRRSDACHRMRWMIAPASVGVQKKGCRYPTGAARRGIRVECRRTIRTIIWAAGEGRDQHGAVRSYRAEQRINYGLCASDDPSEATQRTVDEHRCPTLETQLSQLLDDPVSGARFRQLSLQSHWKPRNRRVYAAQLLGVGSERSAH